MEPDTKTLNRGAFVKGEKRPGQGRPKGSTNRATQNAREAIARLVDDNADRLQGWIDQIAEKEGPMAAWRCFMDVVEYHIPKLARTEHTGAGGGAVQHDVVFEVVGVPPKA